MDLGILLLNIFAVLAKLVLDLRKRYEFILHTKLWSSLSQNAWTSYFGLEVTATSIQNVRKLAYKLDELGSSFGVGVRNVEVNSDSLRIRLFESANI